MIKGWQELGEQVDWEPTEGKYGIIRRELGRVPCGTWLWRKGGLDMRSLWVKRVLQRGKLMREKTLDMGEKDPTLKVMGIYGGEGLG